MGRINISWVEVAKYTRIRSQPYSKLARLGIRICVYFYMVDTIFTEIGTKYLRHWLNLSKIAFQAHVTRLLASKEVWTVKLKGYLTPGFILAYGIKIFYYTRREDLGMC